MERGSSLLETIDRLHAIAPNALRPFLLSVAADVFCRLGMSEKGLELIDEADAVMLLTSERWAEAEIGRIRGTLLAGSPKLDLAERCFRAALATAQAQSAGSFVRRTSVDLAALLNRTGRAEEGHRILDASRNVVQRPS